MWKKNHSTVLVAGAGPIGMTAAICLSKEGIDFEIVDKSSGPGRHSKACMLSPETLEFLEELDLLDEVLAKAIKIHAIQLFEGSRRLANVSLGSLPASHPFIASIPQMDLEEILLKRLHKLHKKVLWNHRVSAVHRLKEGLCVEVDRLGEHMTGYAVMHEEKLVDSTITFLPRVLLAADGLYSLVRRLDKISYEVVGKDLVSLLFEVRRNPREDSILKLGFGREGTSAYVPLPHGLARYGFTIDKLKEFSADRDRSHQFYDDDLEKFPELSETHFRQLVNNRMPYLLENLREITWRASVPFGVRLSESIWTNGIFLLGDAARSGFPIGAKSLNLGLPEAGAVVKALPSYLKSGDDSELVAQANNIRMEWEDLASMVYFGSVSEKGSPDAELDPNIILQALPLTGDSLEYVAEKLTKHLGSGSHAIA
jgi:2-polyprenyl-6-methoxyphenol hydroxylase-like FAD-dependent oxidoreductase